MVKENVSPENLFLGKRLKDLRVQRGFKQADIATSADVSVDTIGRWEAGNGSPSADKLKFIAQKLSTTAAYLLGETEDSSLPGKTFVNDSSEDENSLRDPLQHPNGGRILGPESLTWVPVISPIVKVSAGTGNLCTDVEWERIDDFPLFDGEIAALYSNNGLLSMYVEGDSMEPQVHDGDLVVFKKTTEWVSGNVMVVCLDGRLLVKGVVRGPKGDTILRSTNKNYRDIEIGEESFFLVYGRVLRIIRHWEPKPVL